MISSRPRPLLTDGLWLLQGGEWQVDLDTMGDGRPTHMKGNIMHSVVFATDSAGRPLPAPVSLLVAASFAGQGDGDLHTRTCECRVHTDT